MASLTGFSAAPEYQPMLRELNIDAEAIFEHPQIRPWRKLPDRENCLLQATLTDGTAVRWHVKRYFATNRAITPAEHEVNGRSALERAGIPSAKLIAFGTLPDRRSFIIFDDLTGSQPLDKLIAGGEKFETFLKPTAALSAQLHHSGLHHRDLYLCHFMGRPQARGWDLHLIDVARVKALPKLFRRRWIIKDVAQFIYSTDALEITSRQQQAWLDEYCAARGITSSESFRRAVLSKRDWITRHDQSLRRKQPGRNVSIPIR